MEIWNNNGSIHGITERFVNLVKAANKLKNNEFLDKIKIYDGNWVWDGLDNSIRNFKSKVDRIEINLEGNVYKDYDIDYINYHFSTELKKLSVIEKDIVFYKIEGYIFPFIL